MNGSVALQVEDAEAQNLREALRAAHSQKHAAEQKLTGAQRALARGEALVADAQGELQRHEQSANLVAEAEARRLADLAADRPAALPDDGAEERARIRQTLETKLADATRAVGILQREADAAKADLAKASRQIDVAIEALLREQGERIATETRAAEAIARDLRLQLTGLAGQWMTRADGQPAVIGMGPQAMRALNNLPLNDDRCPRRGPAHVSPSAAFARDWQRTIAELKADPDAALPGAEE